MQPAALALLMAVGVAGSADPAATPSCSGCHAPVELAAVHREVPCATCHPGAVELPHPQPPGVSCGEAGCHPLRRSEGVASAHDRTPGAEGLFGPDACVTCHGGHALRSGTAAAEAAAGLDRDCVRCHHDESACTFEGPHEPIAGAPDGADRAAGALPCAACHGFHQVRDLDDPMAPLSRMMTGTTCGRCHPSELERYRVSPHARGVAEGLPFSPTCLGCHEGSGPSPSPEQAMSSERVVTTCTGCHEDPRVLAASELPFAVVESYEASVHGVAFLHGATDVAVCASCHDPHQVLPPSDPRSSVSPGKVRETCATCHEEVDDRMLAAVHREAGRGGGSGLLGSLRVFFPVAGRSANLLLVAGVGAAVGVLSGFYGVGASFLMTPLLVFIGIPAAVAAASDSVHLTAVATANAVQRGLKGTLDLKLGLVLVAGGWLGGGAGVLLVRWLRELGSFDFALRVVFVVILGFIGTSTLLDVLRSARPGVEAGESGRPGGWLERLPVAVDFPRSGVRASLVLLVGAGIVVGLLAALLGVSGGFLMLPVLIYVAGVPNRIAVGTDLFQIVLTCGLVGVLHAIANGTVDAPLALVLFAGSVVGVRVGGALARRIHGELVGAALAVVVLAVAAGLAWQLLTPPDTVIQFARSGGLFQ